MDRDEIKSGDISWTNFQQARAELARKLARDSEIYLLETMWEAPAGCDERPGFGGASANAVQP